MRPTAESVFHYAVQTFDNRRIKSALEQFNSAERLGYDRNACAGYRWQCCMMLGQFEQAWRECDLLHARGESGQLWDGLPFTGKPVVVRCLHGYGDAIQFARYLPLLRSRASSVIVETHPEMIAILQRVRGVDEVTTWQERTGRDQQIEIMELPRAFRTSVETVPRRVPYLDVHSRGDRLPDDGRPKIGILWAASSWSPGRSMPLRRLAPLLALEDFSFFSFQRGSERAELRAYKNVHDTATFSPTIADTAKDLLEIDLLITVDTMAAHLAGALGRPVWLMLPFQADWRWMVGRDDSPWYPTMRLFRQPRRDSGWDPVVSQVVRELVQRLRAPVRQLEFTEPWSGIKS